MTQRDLNRMDRWARTQAIREAATEVNGALNLFGLDASPISDILDADTDGEIDRACDALLTPECSHRRGACDHAFPPHFVRSAATEVNALRRLATQMLRVS